MAFYEFPNATIIEALSRNFVINNPAMSPAYGDPDYLISDGRLAWQHQAVIINDELSAFLEYWNAGKNDTMRGLLDVESAGADADGQILLKVGGLWTPTNLTGLIPSAQIFSGITPNGVSGDLIINEPVYTLQNLETYEDVVGYFMTTLKVDIGSGNWIDLIGSFSTEADYSLNGSIVELTFKVLGFSNEYKNKPFKLMVAKY